jgi:DNA-binding CsgD family transcriptional regulator
MKRLPRERAVRSIARLAGQPTDLVSFWHEATDLIAGVVPHFWTPCWYTLDPASLLVTSHYHDGLPEFSAAWLVNEYYGDDVNRMIDVIRSDAGVSTLHEATGGNPASSPRWHDNMQMGSDQEMIVRLRSRAGEVWGMLGLYREPGRAAFDDTDKQFLRAASPYLAEGARRALLVGEATDPEVPDAPGLLTLTDRWEIESVTPGVERWLAQLPDGDWSAGRLPSAVISVAGRARHISERSSQPTEVAVARARTASGTWVVLHGACLAGPDRARVAVIIDSAHPARIFPLLMSAYGLTERERAITRLVLQGNSTAQIAAELVVSAHTVQQHLKNIFDKTGVRSRRDLVAKVFFTHYEPRLRENEQRTLHDKPIRGQPRNAPTRAPAIAAASAPR